MLVKKIPAKAATMVADEYEARMETGEKSVSFSSTDEILEIESRRRVVARASKNRLLKAQSVRERLGLSTAKLTATKSAHTDTQLHGTKKIVILKQSVKRNNSQTLNVSPLKSDEAKKSIKSRLTLKRALGGPEVNKLVNRIGRVSLSARLGTKAANGQHKAKPSSSNSVFDRLGFNKK